ncbi:hypothetical protein M8818_006058 [Zalaria obscura]|uniref:Uncharacterized protein n=1 Tax=Zalaria obscura TaxID=2024903 RepID=A0ACC3S788_9PEZI
MDSRDRRDTRDNRDSRPRRDRSTSRDRERGSYRSDRGGRRGGMSTGASQEKRRSADRVIDDRPSRREGRSRSPMRDGRGARDSPRQRTPPRGPRSGRADSPGRGARGGISQPSSRAPPGPKSVDPKRNGVESATADGDEEMDEDEDEEAQMRRLMGFSGFRSTKNTKVPGNDKLYGVRKDKQTEYRQYMNRVGGFNRPLSPSRT